MRTYSRRLKRASSREVSALESNGNGSGRRHRQSLRPIAPGQANLRAAIPATGPDSESGSRQGTGCGRTAPGHSAATADAASRERITSNDSGYTRRSKRFSAASGFGDSASNNGRRESNEAGTRRAMRLKLACASCGEWKRTAAIAAGYSGSPAMPACDCSAKPFPARFQPVTSSSRPLTQTLSLAEDSTLPPPTIAKGLLEPAESPQVPGLG